MRRRDGETGRVSVRGRGHGAMVEHMSEPTQSPPEPEYDPDQDPDADPEQLQQNAERPSQAEGADDDGD